MPTACTTWSMLVTIVSSPQGSASEEAYPRPAARFRPGTRLRPRPALSALTIRAIGVVIEHPNASIRANVAGATVRSCLAGRRIRMLGRDSWPGRAAFALGAGRAAPAVDPAPVRCASSDPPGGRLPELDVRPGLFRRDTGISRRVVGASSSPNSSRTGEFPFGTGRGNAALGGVAPVRTAADFQHDRRFSTN
jgi:hypothetical protein